MFGIQILSLFCLCYCLSVNGGLAYGVDFPSSCRFNNESSFSAIALSSEDLPYSQLAIKPSINWSNVSNVSASCCLDLDVAQPRGLYFCDGAWSLMELFQVIGKDGRKLGDQLSLYLGNEQESVEFLLQSKTLTIISINQVHVYGYGNVTIRTVNNTAHPIFYLENVTDVYIQNLMLWSSIEFYSCRNIQLMSVHVQNSRSRACSIYIPYRVIEPLPIKFQVKFSFCSFTQNGCDDTDQNGGALYFDIHDNNRPIVVHLQNCYFSDNKAHSGGALYAKMHNLPTTSTNSENCSELVPMFIINNCLFENNRVIHFGGALYFKSHFGALFDIEALDSKFLNNSAENGGAFYAEMENFENTCNVVSRLSFYKCDWSFNEGKLSAVMDLHNTQRYRSLVTLVNNNITNNKARNVSYGGETYCMVFCNGMNFTFADSIISHNEGSGFCNKDSKLTVQGNVLFSSNYNGYQGGGIFLDSGAWISLANGSDLILDANSAILGGGIYQTSIASKNICFLQKSVNSAIRFIDNDAYNRGTDMYFQAPSDICQQELANASLHIITGSRISSSVHIIELERNAMNVTLGQRLVFHATIKDYFGFPASTFVYIYLRKSGKNIFQNTSYNLVGFTSFSFINGTNSPNVHVAGPNQASSPGEYTLMITTSDQVPQIQQQIQLNVYSCGLGFNHNSSTRICECSSSNLHCDLDEGTACVRQGYWFGQVEGTGITVPCVSGKCKNIDNCDVCASNGLTTFCQLPKNESAECIGNWAGILCSECLPGYAYTFQAQQCVKSSSCKNARALIPTVLMIVYLLSVIGIIIVIIKLGFNIRSGYMYCIIYYFSIVRLILPENEVSRPLEIMVSIFQSILQLDPYFLGFIPVCVSPHITILELNVLLFISPLIVTIVIVSVISLSQYCSKSFQHKDNTALKAISLLVLLSFTTLTEASFNIIIPIRYDTIHDYYVKIQPSTEYFNFKDHLVWWLVAMLVLCVLVIPFTLLLLLAPVLVRFFNLTKIKPFLDEFQSCYKDKYRWMAGYYFMCRVILFLCLTSSVAEKVEFQYIAMIISILILVFHMLFQPYEDKWLNVIDSVLLCDLVFISLLYTVSSEIVFKEFGGGETLRQFFTYVLVIIPIVYIIAIIVAAILKKLPVKMNNPLKQINLQQVANYSILRSGKFISQQDFEQSQLQEGTSYSSSSKYYIPTTSEVGLDQCSFSEYREPLLDDEILLSGSPGSTT